MAMLIVLAVVLLGAAFAVAWIATRPVADDATGIGRSLAYLEALNSAPQELRDDAEKSFNERVLTPLLGRFNNAGRRLTGGEGAQKIQRKLDLAGGPAGWTVERVASAKVAGAVVGFVAAGLYGLILSANLQWLLIAVVTGGLLGFFAPNLWLYQKAYNRAERIQNDLADAIDLLTISVESGLGFDAALQQVARNTEGPVAEEFARVLREMQLGVGRAEALRKMADRTTVTDLRSFVGALAQAEVFGVSVGQVLRTQSKEMRVRRRQHAEKKAQQVPVKITVPLIFCILPSLFIVVMGPAVITIAGSNFGGG
ncbi:type II secretion system F family protein [Nocardioides zeae]|uniref:Type II secretion system F family protein n=1 Tax=Nocardioides imazamoxiresistens TaxID=3231893 RepID=A0ABU3PYD5_9ACTN|nr:type II secretion system F family protein [Nocardioides zeae]MDT9593790.1 type II secretion system F family protein [Nocardioides zeae]